MPETLTEVKKQQDKKKQDKKTTVKRSFGKRRAKIESYFRFNYPRNKLRQILKHNGLAAAEKWAAEHKATILLKGILKRHIN